jgi:DNA-binding response OmpR family regulator
MNILIIEPSITFQSIIDGKLRGHGIECQLVSTAAQAKDILLDQQFDLICMSLYLPDMYGLDFCEQLRQSNVTELYPILLLTAEEDKNVHKLAFKLGVTEIFNKQDLNDLLHYISHLSQQSNLYKKVDGNVLYVEDIQSQADTAIAILQDAGLSVSHHLTAEAAYNDFCKSDYDLLITDVILHGDMSGLGLVRVVRSTGNRKGMIPILAMSDLEHASRKINLLRSGVNDYVSKPFLPEELVARVKNLVLTKQLVDKAEEDNKQLSASNLELKNTKDLLIRSQKLEALGVMAGGISHEFNNALAVISGNAEMLLNASSEESQKHTNKILQTTDNASKLVHQILMLSRMEAVNFKPINMANVVTESVEMIRSIIPTKIEIRQDICDENLNILGDTTQIYQIVVNLCTNAHHAMEKEGGILQISLKTFGKSLMFTISDNGCGMTQEAQQMIFDPFFTTKEVGKGTGLGLSVVYRIVENHQGNISVDSDLGTGTTISIMLPMTTEVIPLEAIQVNYKEGIGHVLIVEDEADISHLYQAYLESVGYETTVLDNGLSALKLFKEHPDRFDVVLTDHNMPKMTGEDLAKELLLIRPELPIILATGYNELLGKNQVQGHGIRQYLLKPVKLGLVAQTIASCLNTDINVTENDKN